MASGQFTWIDLMTNDPQGAIAFYKKVLGWETESWQGAKEGMPPYTMWKANGESFGGTMQHAEDAKGAPAMWLGYVSTDDIDASLKKASSLGATVHMGKTPIPDTGSFAVLSDPQGATFALFQRAPGRPVTGDGSLPILSWTELSTSDPEAALDFYSKLCGWNKTDSMDMGEGRGTYQMFGSGGRSIGGTMKKNPDMPATWLFYFKVDDAHKRVEAAKKEGAQVMYGPMEVPGGDLAALLTDPQGAAVGFVSPKA